MIMTVMIHNSIIGDRYLLCVLIERLQCTYSFFDFTKCRAVQCCSN